MGRLRHRPDPHMPAAAQQPQQQEDRNPTGQPDDHFRVTEHGHLSLQDVVGGLALRDSGLTRPQFIQAFIERGSGPGGGRIVAHHDVEQIWKINQMINKIRIRIHLYGTKYRNK